MSQFVTILTNIKDIAALRDASTELGFAVDENADARGIGTQHHGEFVIRLKGPCDIAVNRNPDHTYALATDWWGAHVEKEVGPNYGRLLQLYAVHKATQAARQRGLAVQRSAHQSGAIKLTLAGGAL